MLKTTVKAEMKQSNISTILGGFKVHFLNYFFSPKLIIKSHSSEWMCQAVVLWDAETNLPEHV